MVMAQLVSTRQWLRFTQQWLDLPSEHKGMVKIRFPHYVAFVYTDLVSTWQLLFSLCECGAMVKTDLGAITKTSILPTIDAMS